MWGLWVGCQRLGFRGGTEEIGRRTVQEAGPGLLRPVEHEALDGVGLAKVKGPVLLQRGLAGPVGLDKGHFVSVAGGVWVCGGGERAFSSRCLGGLGPPRAWTHSSFWGGMACGSLLVDGTRGTRREAIPCKGLASVEAPPRGGITFSSAQLARGYGDIKWKKRWPIFESHQLFECGRGRSPLFHTWTQVTHSV